jgi:hypothetical protein
MQETAQVFTGRSEIGYAGNCIPDSTTPEAPQEAEYTVRGPRKRWEEAHMRTIRRAIPVLALLTGIAAGEEQKRASSAPGDLMSQHFAIPCSRMWPHAMRTLVKDGFRPVSNDRDGGVAIFEWTEGAAAPWTKNTEGQIDVVVFPRGNRLKRRWVSIGIQRATLILSDTENAGCNVDLSVVFSGYNEALLQRGWETLKTTGKAERRILDQIIDSTSAIKLVPRTAPKATAGAEESTNRDPKRSSVAPSEPDSNDVPATEVVELPHPPK